MFMYALSLIMAFSFIFIPFIAIIKSSVTLSNFLIFTGYIGKTLQKNFIFNAIFAWLFTNSIKFNFIY